jgi:Bacterial-like globin
MSEPDNSAPSLYRWAGGEAPIRRLIDRFYDRVERDELLSPFFPGGVSEDHRAYVTGLASLPERAPALELAPGRSGRKDRPPHPP